MAKSLTTLKKLPLEERRQIVEGALDDYDNGTPIKVSAEKLGVSENTLYRYIVELCQDGWKAAVISRALVRKEAAEKLMDDATDGFALAKAEKQVKSAQWDLERVFQRVYAPKQEPVPSGTQVVIQLVSFSGEGDKVIEVKVEPQPALENKPPKAE